MTNRWPVLEGAEPWSHHADDSDVGVLMLHGFTANPSGLRPLGESIADAGFHVEIVRFPGHGTHWRDLARTRYADWRVAAECAFDALARRCEKIVVFGHSWGGTVALDLAAGRCRRHPDNPLAGIVTVNATILMRDDPLSRAGGILQYLIPVAPRELANAPRDDVAKEGVVESAYTLVPSKSGWSLLRELPRIRDGLKEITVPVFVVYSPHDKTVPSESSEALVEMLHTDVEVLVCERSQHLIPVDNDAELLAEETIAFVGKVSADIEATVA